MTKVRTSGGKITVTIGGDFKTYAKEDIIYNSQKTISFTGKENGITHGNPENLEFTIEESEDYKLESKFALEQLFEFAKKDSKAMFCFWMSDIFGADIPLDAYEQLYKDASDKKESINPKITVAKFVPGFGATYYSGIYKNGKPIDDKNKTYKNHIIISEDFINKAIDKNLHQKLLMIALVEEFGHHLDYVLRYEYSKVKGDASKDEGAKYTAKMNQEYKCYLIDPFKVKEQHYATATIKKKETKLIWDFADLNEKLKEYVDNRTEKDDNYFAGFEFFGAGLGDGLHGLGHQAIENIGLGKIDRYQDKSKEVPNKERLQIYFGNWLRDFSQFVDPMVVRPVANALDMLSDEYKIKNTNKDEYEKVINDLTLLLDENRVTSTDQRTYQVPAGVNIKSPEVSLNYEKVAGFSVPTGFSIKALEAEIKWESTTLSPVKLSRQAITSLVEIIGIKEFGKLKVEADNKEGRPQNYMKYLEDFRKSFSEITPELLGVYKPQEHIDNPLALHPKFICEANKAKNKPCPPANLNNKLDPDFVKDPIDAQWGNNKAFGTKNYIRGNGKEPFESAYDCFIKFIKKSNPNTVEGRINFGAALHILEDYYAHSNFCELAVMKVYDPEVFPWDNLPSTCKKGSLKEHKADSASNKHAVTSILDKSKFKFKTLTNSELQPQSVKNYIKANHKENVSDNVLGYYQKLDPANANDLNKVFRNKGLYYSHAACAVVQTGSFGLLDTIASIAPKINNKLFTIDVKEQDKLKENERTITDALIYELLKDVSSAQANDTKEANSKYKGTNDNAYSEAFLKYLDFRDFMVKDRVAGYSIKDVTNAFGIFNYIKQYIDIINNTRNHFLCLMAINLIDDYQTLLENDLTLLEKGNWKVHPYGPSHTQLAKDNGIQPLHGLAVELAAEAVHQVGELFKIRDLEGIKELAETLFVHPMYTDWMDEIVIKWCVNNRYKVKAAHEASIVLYGISHAYEEIVELKWNLSIIRDFNLNQKQQEQYDSAIAKLGNRVQQGRDRLNALLEKAGLPKETYKSIEETKQEHLEEMGYGK